jgi:DNA ligase-1
MKPMLATDWEPNKLKFPVMAQPKIDGVRALNLSGVFTGRSLKTFGNRYITEYFSQEIFRGFDGELAAERRTHPDLCRLTTSAVSSHEGQPWLLWHIFDYVTPETQHLPYARRFEQAYGRILQINRDYPEHGKHLSIVPTTDEINDLATVERLDDRWLAEGYEGTILRDPKGHYKYGRCTVREGLMLRIKRFADAEGVVESVAEGQHNANEATTNPLGYTERSTHQENMIPNGMIGTMDVRLLQSIKIGDKTISEGSIVTISAGRMTADLRKYYLENQDQIIGKVAKFQYFPKGVKDKLRFPTFQSFRAPEDM